ncbi:TIGR03667 family PPOX class F420-dependent oxidoreductase [Agromyces italicus]|uniref:TIGR03667 family PPOX class F420-dependent oxidoreductase n=1 Tax=Agromyces italicus TaxID=279572 RepID=UPI0003B67262|nr:TIGR03667 family PPOX class F420-dependent oxidoreductase [Agromyces italicus]
MSTELQLSERVIERLATEETVWLTTVNRHGTPMPTPVWFVWNDGELMLLSQRDTPKLANLARNPRTALHFNTDAGGDDVAVFTGSARIGEVGEAPEWAEYAEKYASAIERIDYTPERFIAEYCVPVRVTVERVRSW